MIRCWLSVPVWFFDRLVDRILGPIDFEDYISRTAQTEPPPDPRK